MTSLGPVVRSCWRSGSVAWISVSVHETIGGAVTFAGACGSLVSYTATSSRRPVARAPNAEPRTMMVAPGDGLAGTTDVIAGSSPRRNAAGSLRPQAVRTARPRWPAPPSEARDGTRTVIDVGPQLTTSASTSTGP